MKTALASLLLPIAVCVVATSAARAETTDSGLSITATPSSFGSALQTGGQVNWTVEVRYPATSPERFKQEAGQGTTLVVSQALTNLTLVGAPQITCNPSAACHGAPQVQGQSIVTTLAPSPTAADVKISVSASVVAAGDVSVAVSRAINYFGRAGQPVSVATLTGTASDAPPPPNNATNSAETNETNATNTADNEAGNTASNAANAADNNAANVASDTNAVVPNSGGDGWWPWVLVAAGAAAVAIVATTAAINHAQWLKWSRLVAIQARVDRTQSVANAGSIPEAGPTVRLAAHVEDGPAEPRGRIPVKKVE